MCSDWHTLQQDALKNRDKNPSHGHARGEMPQGALWAGSRAFSGEPGPLASLKLVAQSGTWLARGESCSYNLVRDLGLKSRAGFGFSFTDQSETLLCSRLDEVHLPGGPLGPRPGSTGRVLWTPALRSAPSWRDDLAVWHKAPSPPRGWGAGVHGSSGMTLYPEVITTQATSSGHTAKVWDPALKTPGGLSTPLSHSFTAC